MRRWAPTGATRRKKCSACSEAKAADAEEDAHYGPDRRGDELPEGLGGRRERLKRLKEAKERLPGG